jgi:TubC N-terminal docking domain
VVLENNPTYLCHEQAATCSASLHPVVTARFHRRKSLRFVKRPLRAAAKGSNSFEDWPWHEHRSRAGFMRTSTPNALLVRLCKSGVELRLTRDRQRITAPARSLTPDLREALAAHRSEIVRLLSFVEDYRSLLRKMFLRLASRKGPGTDECSRFVDEQTRYADELGPVLQASVFEMAARDWRAATGTCPWCSARVRCPDPVPHSS